MPERNTSVTGTRRYGSRAAASIASRRATLVPRGPSRKGPRGGGQGAGLTGAEEKPDHQQRWIVERNAGEHGERGPPADDPRQDKSRAEPITPPAGGNLEQRVGDI